MSTDKDELIKILSPLLEDGITAGEMRKKILEVSALISQREQAARVDEIMAMKKYMISNSPFISEIIEPRLAELKALTPPKESEKSHE